MFLYPIADTHTDFLSTSRDTHTPLNCSMEQQGQLSLPALRKGGVRYQMFAAFIDQSLPIAPSVRCLQLIDDYYRMLDMWGGAAAPLTRSQIDSPTQSDCIGTVLSIEGGEACEGHLELLRIYYRLGVRAMALLWNYENEIGYPAKLTEYADRGLKPFGRACVKEMNRIGMAVDVSHLNEKGFWEAYDLSERPLFASHSDAKALCMHPRNLTDEQIRAIIRQKGYIGLNFFTPFLVDQGPSTLDDLVRHALYILDLGGENVLGFGSDFDGIDDMPEGMHGAQDFQLVVQALERAGVDRATMEKITHGNFLRYIRPFLAESSHNKTII